MITTASQITSLTVVYSAVYSGPDQRKHQSSASLAFGRGLHRDRWIPRTKGQLRGKCFHLMTSSCSPESGVTLLPQGFIEYTFYLCSIDVMPRTFVKVWFRGLWVYEEIKESLHPPRQIEIHFWSYYIAFWCWSLCHKHSNSPSKDRKEHHVFMVVDTIVTSQCRSTRSISQSRVAMHDETLSVALFVVDSKMLPCREVLLTKLFNKSNGGEAILCKIKSPFCWWRPKGTR